MHETVIGNLSYSETIAFPGLQSGALVSVPRVGAMVVLFGLTHRGLIVQKVQNSERQLLMGLMGTMRCVCLLRWFGMRARSAAILPLRPAWHSPSSDAHFRPHTPPALRTFDFLVNPRLLSSPRSTFHLAGE